MAEMHAVLEALMSHENASRRKAEAYFQEQLAANATGVVQQLLDIFGGSSSPPPAEVIRSFAGVLLRRAVEKTQFTPEMNAQLRGVLINMWKAEKNPLLLKRLAHVMSQSALSTSWIDLLPQVLDNVSGSLCFLLHAKALSGVWSHSDSNFDSPLFSSLIRIKGKYDGTRGTRGQYHSEAGSFVD